jgi:hypothetical protein
LDLGRIKPGVTISGPLLPEPVEVLTVADLGNATRIVGKGLKTGYARDAVFTRGQLAQLNVSAEERLDGDATLFRLGVEAHRLGLAYEYDPYFSLSIARVDPLANVSSAVIEFELRRRKRTLATLERSREHLAAKLGALDRQIELLGGAANGRATRGPRPRNAMSLAEALANVLKDKPMTVVEAAEAVRKSGYRTTSQDFRTQVNIALIKGGFKRVGRGQYATK